MRRAFWAYKQAESARAREIESRMDNEAVAAWLARFQAKRNSLASNA
jgi:hypothetical protein